MQTLGSRLEPSIDVGAEPPGRLAASSRDVTDAALPFDDRADGETCSLPYVVDADDVVGTACGRDDEKLIEDHAHDSALLSSGSTASVQDAGGAAGFDHGQEFSL